MLNVALAKDLLKGILFSLRDILKVLTVGFQVHAILILVTCSFVGVMLVEASRSVFESLVDFLLPSSECSLLCLRHLLEALLLLAVSLL